MPPQKAAGKKMLPGWVRGWWVEKPFYASQRLLEIVCSTFFRQIGLQHTLLLAKKRVRHTHTQLTKETLPRCQTAFVVKERKWLSMLIQT